MTDEDIGTPQARQNTLKLRIAKLNAEGNATLGKCFEVTDITAKEVALRDAERWRVMRNLVSIAIASQRADGTDIPLGEQCREAAALIDALHARADASEALIAAIENKAKYMSDTTALFVVQSLTKHRSATS